MEDSLIFKFNLKILSKIEFLKLVYCNIFMRMYYRIWQIELGAGFKFYGLTIFRRYPGSSIKIGSNARFRSAPKSNLIGVNRSCIISTNCNKNAQIIIGDNCGFTSTVIGAFESIKIGNNLKSGANT
ncbi:MAG: hypothetical protein MH472_02495, partial [Bacteroidia bacterium]|nr:hypothetical protein [Bacteroidia bacterium]